jgi:hypothetical protein
MKVARRGDWLSANTGEGLVMLNPDRGDYVGLSRVGARIWELIETPREVAEICALLVSEFDVTPETCRVEVEAFVAELLRNGVAGLEPAPAA